MDGQGGIRLVLDTLFATRRDPDAWEANSIEYAIEALRARLDTLARNEVITALTPRHLRGEVDWSQEQAIPDLCGLRRRFEEALSARALP